MELELRDNDIGYYWYNKKTGEASQSFGRKEDAELANKVGLLQWFPQSRPKFSEHGRYKDEL